MSWSFYRAKAFYTVMGLFTAIAIVAVVASLRRMSFQDAFLETRLVLEAWAKLVPSDSLEKPAKLLGYPVAVIILGLAAYVLDLIGDMTLPAFSSVCRYFKRLVVEWAVLQKSGDWGDAKKAYRTVTGIEGNSQEWEDRKVSFGRFKVRFSRITVYIALLLLIAGIVDVCLSAEFRSRGIAFFVIGLAGALTSIALWGKRYDNYIDNFMSNYEDELRKHPEHKFEIPKSYLQAKEG